MKVKSESEVAQSCPTPSNSMDCSLPGSSSMGFSRQEYWSGVPLPSLLHEYINPQIENRVLNRCCAHMFMEAFFPIPKRKE